MSSSNSENTVSGVSADRYLPPASLRSLQMGGLGVGAVGVVLCIIGFLSNKEQFLQSYLVAWVFWLLIALGSLGWLMINHLTAGSWGIVMRRSWEAAARTLPFLAILAIPMAFGMPDLFAWAREGIENDPVVSQKLAYLNVGSFWVRFFIYFGIWTTLAFLLSSNSATQDRDGDPRATRRMRVISGPGLVILVMSASFCCWDWMMSLDPHWFSSLYGIYFVCMNTLSALAFTCILAWYLNQREPMQGVFKTKYFHDMGKLCLALTMFWAYMTLSQFLITWSGNIPEFATWYVARNENGWKAFSIFLIIFHFFVPFLVLLSAGLKKKPGRLALIALYLLVMQWVDLVWQVVPTWHQNVHFHWLDVAALAAVGGLWLFLFVNEVNRRTLVPINDPFIPRVLPHES